MARCAYNTTCQRAGNPTRKNLCYRHFDKSLTDRGHVKGKVDAQPAIWHIEQLMASGVTQNSIARTAGVSSYTLNLIRHGKRPLVRAETSKRILAVRTVTKQPDGALVPAVGTVRRLRALFAIGYTATHLAGELGLCTAQVSQFLEGAELVRVSTDRSVRAVFERLQMVPLPRGRVTSRAINKAAERGWVPPLAWDESTIDDPQAVPFGVRRELKNLPLAERLEDVVELRSWGFTDEQIAGRLGVTRKYVLKLAS